MTMVLSHLLSKYVKLLFNSREYDDYIILCFIILYSSNIFFGHVIVLDL